MKKSINEQEVNSKQNNQTGNCTHKIKLKEKKKKWFKRHQKLTPMRKCIHMGPFTHLLTTGITALQMEKRKLFE